MPFAFIGLMGLFFAALIFFIDSHINPVRILTPLIIGGISLAIGIRSRYALWNEETGEISLVWGKVLPWKYKAFAKNDWKALKVEKCYPVVITPSGSGVRASTLPPRWNVIGLTKQGKTIFLSESPSEKEAIMWYKKLSQSLKITTKLFNTKVYLSSGEKGNLSPKEAWEQNAFFKKDPAASKLYAALCETNNWQCIRALSIYDADVPGELGLSDFDITLLASNIQVTKPWKVIKRLQESGWIQASEKEITQLVELEKKYGWATPSML